MSAALSLGGHGVWVVGEVEAMAWLARLGHVVRLDRAALGCTAKRERVELWVDETLVPRLACRAVVAEVRLDRNRRPLYIGAVLLDELAQLRIVLGCPRFAVRTRDANGGKLCERTVRGLWQWRFAVLEAHTMLALWWFQVRVGSGSSKKAMFGAVRGHLYKRLLDTARGADGERRAAVRRWILVRAHAPSTAPASRSEFVQSVPTKSLRPLLVHQ